MNAQPESCGDVFSLHLPKLIYVCSMVTSVLIFLVALAVLLLAAHFFTQAAETIGAWLGFPAFVIGVFIVGVGTSLPELISGILSVQKGVSEIVAGNIIGANISNILLITGLVAVLNRKTIQMNTNYLYIDLHFLIGSFMYFVMIAYDGGISFVEAFVGIVIFLIYSIYLIKGENNETESAENQTKQSMPIKAFGLLLLSGIGIYFGADYTVDSLSNIATGLQIPASIVALTLLSLGTTLPELAVNIAAIRQGKAEMALGNVLGSCIFNSLMIPPIAAGFGPIAVPADLRLFSLPVMVACGLLFYLLTQDKRISTWEGWLFMALYVLFILKIAGF
jgi:cation:H+ antiporter